MKRCPTCNRVESDDTFISSLSLLPNLNVKARSSVFRYKGKDANPQKVGKELNVQAILNGRVVQRGELLTLSLELIDAETENVIWSDKYDRRQADLVALQSWRDDPRFKDLVRASFCRNN
jgi:TolB-like protein